MRILIILLFVFFCKIQFATAQAVQQRGFTLPTSSFTTEQLEEKPVFRSMQEAFKVPENVYKLELAGDQLKMLPEAFVKFENLEELDLSNNLFEKVPEVLRNLKKLKILKLQRNKITEFPNFLLTDLPRLQLLFLNNNNIRAFPNNIRSQRELRALYLSNNQISFIPMDIANLSRLAILDLQNNPLNTAILSVSTINFIRENSVDTRHDAIKELVRQANEQEKQKIIEAHNHKEKLKADLEAEKQRRAKAEIQRLKESEKILKYESDLRLKEQERRLLEAEKEKLNIALQYKEQKNYNQRIIIWVVCAFLLMLTVFSLVFYNKNKRLRRSESIISKQKKILEQTNTAIELKNREIEAQNEQLLLNVQLLEESQEEIQQQHRDLEQKNTELENLQQIREVQARMIVHDFKNPIGQILAYSSPDYLASTSAIEDLHKSFKVINKAARRIESLSRTILDLYKFKRSEVVLDRQTHNIRDTANHAIELLDTAIIQNNLEVENLVAPYLYAHYDQEKISRVFDNLLSNAIKHNAPNGRITLRSEDLGGYVRINITDTGAGIEPTKLERIFQEFEAFGSAAGYGLGLAFCKAAIQAHGTEIGVRSQLNVGSTFYFDLPKVVIELHHHEEPTYTDDQLALVLNHAEKSQLMPFVAELLQYKFYNIDEIENTLRATDIDNLNILRWKEAMLKAVEQHLEADYQQLLNLVNEVWA